MKRVEKPADDSRKSTTARPSAKGPATKPADKKLVKPVKPAEVKGKTAVTGSPASKPPNRSTASSVRTKAPDQTSKGSTPLKPTESKVALSKVSKSPTTAPVVAEKSDQLVEPVGNDQAPIADLQAQKDFEDLIMKENGINEEELHSHEGLESLDEPEHVCEIEGLDELMSGSELINHVEEFKDADNTQVVEKPKTVEELMKIIAELKSVIEEATEDTDGIKGGFSGLKIKSKVGRLWDKIDLVEGVTKNRVASLMQDWQNIRAPIRLCKILRQWKTATMQFFDAHLEYYQSQIEAGNQETVTLLELMIYSEELDYHMKDYFREVILGSIYDESQKETSRE